MGYRISRYFIEDLPRGEQVELGDITLCPDTRSVLHGRIVDCNGNTIAGAVVKFFSAPCGTEVCLCDDADELTDLGHVFTDECGQFLFPVENAGDRIFLIKVFAPQDPAVVAGDAEACFDTEDCCF